MRLMVLTSGTRGDVEPFVALARHAALAGHDVRIAVPDGSGVDVDGLDAVSLGTDFRWLARPHGPRAWIAAWRAPAEVRRGMGAMLAAAVRETLDFAPDVVLHHPLVLTAPAVADAVGAPRVVGEMVPVATPSALLPAPGTPVTGLRALATIRGDRRRWTRLTYEVPRAAARLLDGEVRRACAPLPGGGSGRPARSRATVVGASRHLLPRPEDWPDRVHLTGAWQHAAATAPLDPHVARFVDGPPYLVAGFGSMATGDPVARARAVVGAARARGLRSLLLTGWGGLVLPDDMADEDVLAVPAAPLSRVLAGAAVAVHHGGSGTAHTVARAGVPSVVVPFLADQPFWGRQLHELGLAAAPIRPRRLSRASFDPALADALARTGRARRTGQAMAGEDGLAAALDVLTRL